MHILQEAHTIYFNDYLFYGLILSSFVLSYLSTLLIVNVCKKFNLLAYPRETRWHKRPTALYGGIGFFLVTLIASAIFLHISNAFTLSGVATTAIPPLFSPSNTNHPQSLTSIFNLGIEFIFKKRSAPFLGLLIGSSVVFFCGLLDDIFKLRPHYKLLGQLLSVGVATYFGLMITFFDSPIISLFFTIFWFLGISNAFNLLDNMDGLSSGIAIAAGIAIIAHSWMIGASNVAIVTSILVSALFAFWLLNKNPAKIFMGDCGSQFIGFFLGGLAIMGTWKDASNLMVTIFVPIMILSIPIFDTTYVSLMRKFHGKKITDGGKDHLSHRLVALGLSEKRAVNVLIFLGLGTGLVTVFVLHNLSLYFAIALFPLIAIAFVIFGIYLAQINVYNSPASIPSSYLKVPNKIFSMIKFFSSNKKKHSDFDDHKQEQANLNNSNGFFYKTKKVFPSKFFVYHKRRFVEVLLDITMLFLSLFFAYNLRFEGQFIGLYVNQFMDIVIVFIAIKVAILFWLGMYNGDWRYMGIADVLLLLKAAFLSFLVVGAYVGLIYQFQNFSRAVLILDCCFSVMLLGGIRVATRLIGEYIFQHNNNNVPVIVYGQNKDELDISLRRIKMMVNAAGVRYRPVALYCERGSEHYEKYSSQDSIHGIEVVYNREKLYGIMMKNGVKEVLVSNVAFSPESASNSEFPSINSSGEKISKKNSNISNNNFDNDNDNNDLITELKKNGLKLVYRF